MMRTSGFRRWLLIAVAAASLSTMTGRAQSPNTVTWAILVDDLHLDFRSTGRLRDLLRSIGRDLLHEGDAFMFATSGPSNITIPMTADRAAFGSAVKMVAGNGLKPADTLSPPTDPQTVSEVRYRVAVALGAARQTLAQLISHRTQVGGFKTFVYITNGYDLDLDEPPTSSRKPPAGAPPRDRVAPPQSNLAALRSERSALLGAAQRARIRIVVIDGHIVDPGALDLALDRERWQRYETTTQQSVVPLATQSGGIALLDRHDLTDAWPRINRLVGR